jgi:leader peptidase (prepilin peptidase)/N-methyltransferase
MPTELFLTALAATTIGPAAAAAIADWRTQRVPNSWVALAIVPSVTAVLLAHDRVPQLAEVAAGAAVMALPLLLVHLASPAAIGFGDVKLAVPLGAALGVLAPNLTVLALAAGAGLTLLVAGCSRRAAVPFAPGLVAGAATAFVLGSLEGWRVAA